MYLAFDYQTRNRKQSAEILSGITPYRCRLFPRDADQSVNKNNDMTNDNEILPGDGSGVGCPELPTYCGTALLLSWLFALCVPAAILFLIAAGRSNAIYDHYHAGRLEQAKKEMQLVKILIGVGLAVVALSVVLIIDAVLANQNN